MNANTTDRQPQDQAVPPRQAYATLRDALYLADATASIAKSWPYAGGLTGRRQEIMGLIQAEVRDAADKLGIREVEFWTIANSCLTDVRAA
jgi:hypothetical protein